MEHYISVSVSSMPDTDSVNRFWNWSTYAAAAGRAVPQCTHYYALTCDSLNKHIFHMHSALDNLIIIYSIHTTIQISKVV